MLPREGKERKNFCPVQCIFNKLFFLFNLLNFFFLNFVHQTEVVKQSVLKRNLLSIRLFEREGVIILEDLPPLLVIGRLSLPKTGISFSKFSLPH